jgi:hypothetical protein
MIQAMRLRDRAIMGAALYLGFLFVSVIALGWLILIGGKPFTVDNLGPVNAAGLPSQEFRVGEIVGIKRRFCSDQTISLHYFPALRDSRGFLFALPTAMIEQPSGCRDTIYGFRMPDLPAGHYTYVNAVRFQNNLVGRDETSTFPPINFRILR